MRTSTASTPARYTTSSAVVYARRRAVCTTGPASGVGRGRVLTEGAVFVDDGATPRSRSDSDAAATSVEGIVSRGDGGISRSPTLMIGARTAGSVWPITGTSRDATTARIQTMCRALADA